MMARVLVAAILLPMLGGEAAAQAYQRPRGVLPTSPGASTEPARPAEPAPSAPPAVIVPNQPSQVVITAPPPTPRSAPGFSADLNMPGVALPLIKGEIGVIPDGQQVRRYVFSLLVAATQSCGARSDAAALDAVGYVEPNFAPGRNMAEAGLQILMQRAQQYGQAMKSGDVRDLAAAASGPNYQVVEGQEDGAAIVATLGCGSREFKDYVANIERLISQRLRTRPTAIDDVQLSALMSPQYRKRNNIPDPEAVLARRKTETAARQAQAQCQRRYDGPTFCSCLVSGLQSAELSEQDWTAIGGDFSAIVAVATHRPAISGLVQGCVRQ